MSKLKDVGLRLLYVLLLPFVMAWFMFFMALSLPVSLIEFILFGEPNLGTNLVSIGVTPAEFLIDKL